MKIDRSGRPVCQVSIMALAILCSPAAADEVLAPSSERGRGGVFAGLEPTFSWIRMSGFEDDPIENVPGDDVAASAGLFAIQGSFLFDYGVSDSARLGVRLASGKILNSDDSSGAAMQLDLGPAFTLVSGTTELGVEGVIQWYSFDDASASIDSDDLVEGAIEELDGESILALAFAGRVGFRIPMSPAVDVVPALRLQVAPVKLSASGSSAFFEASGGTVTLEDPSSFLAVSGALMVGVRWTGSAP